MLGNTCVSGMLALMVAVGIPYAAAQKQSNQPAANSRPIEEQMPQARPRYRLIDLGTFGGPQSYVNIPDNSYAAVLNNRGAVAGWGDTSSADPYPDFCFNDDCFASHGLVGGGGGIVDLGTLPGGSNSAATWMGGNGLVAGISENGETDPLVAGFPELRGVLWKNGQILDVGTLAQGGYESLANAVNSRGLVVGMATNTTPDPDSMFGLGYQTRAFGWDEKKGMQDLGTLGGPDAMAFLVNERGQIVGDSYTNSNPSAYCANIGFSLTTGAFLWENGAMRNLGSFGGTCTFAFALNERGEVVGGSTLKGDSKQHPFLWSQGRLRDLGTFGGDLGNAIAINDAGKVTGWASIKGNQVNHAFLWKNGVKRDLGTLPGDACSYGFGINAQGAVIGVSAQTCPFETTRPFLWEPDGTMIDMNALIPADASLYLTSPGTINNRGEIAGVGLDVNGNQHAFLLVPCGPSDECEDASASAATRVRPVPAIQESPNGTHRNSIQNLIRSRMGLGRLGVPISDGGRRPTETNQVPTEASPLLRENDEIERVFAGHDAAWRYYCGRYGSPCGYRGFRCCPGLECTAGSTRMACR